MTDLAGAPSRAATLANMSSAITALYGLGYTLAEKDDAEEDCGSDKSSPTTLHCNMYGFGSVHHNAGLQYNVGPAAGMLATPLTPYAAPLAGVGFNLPYCRAHTSSLPLFHDLPSPPLSRQGISIPCWPPATILAST